MYYVYVLYNKEESKFYIGYTKDLKRRIAEHKAGRSHTTKRYSSREFIYYESFISQIDAMRREKYFKTTKGKKALRLMLRDTISENNTAP